MIGAKSFSALMVLSPSFAWLLGSFLLLKVPPIANAQKVGGLHDLNNRLPTSVVYPSTSDGAIPASIISGTLSPTVTSTNGLTASASLGVSSIISVGSSPTSIASSSSLSVSVSSVPSSAALKGITSIASSSIPTATTAKRAAIPACLDTVELSCLNLAANCINSVNSGNSDNLWGIASCAVAATCYGVGDLINSVECQTAFTLTNAEQASLDYTIYANIVGSCAYATGGCPITQQNYIDWYYGTLTAIDTANYPSSNTVVIAFWDTVLDWTATGTTLPYTNLNDYYHYSSYPSTTTVGVSSTSGGQYSDIYWNPNPGPTSGAASETFVNSGETTVIAVPTTSTTVVVVGATLTLGPGGTPVGGVVPSGLSIPGAVTPTWSPDPIVPSTASSVTFVAGTWTSVVPVPTVTGVPVTVTGPPDSNGDGGHDGSWILALCLLGPCLSGTIPAAVSVIGGIIPVPAPPPDWGDGTTWVPPPGTSGSGEETEPDDPDDPDDPQTCSLVLPQYTEPYDGAGGDDDDPPGSDVISARRAFDFSAGGNSSMYHRLAKRSTRTIALGTCGQTYSFSGKSLGSATYYTIDNPAIVPALASSGTTLYSQQGATHVSFDGKVAEHVFEFRYIKDFFSDSTVTSQVDCTWLQTNAWNAQIGGTAIYSLLASAIDQTANIANIYWVAREINRAKSYVANNDKPDASDPPLGTSVINTITDFSATALDSAAQVETLIRAFGALGQYYDQTAAAFQASANRVQTILATITPSTPVFPPLDTLFNDWLRDTVSQYPDRITSRGENTYNFYVNRLNTVLSNLQAANPNANPPIVVPQCLRVYQDNTIVGRLAAAGNNWQALAPAPLVHPTCNSPGTQGSYILFYDTAGNPVNYVGNPTYTVVAQGTNYYGFGPLTSQNELIYDFELSNNPAYGAVCSGIHWMYFSQVGQSTDPLANIFFSCGGASGKALSTVEFYDPGGNPLQCFFNNFNDGSNTFAVDCGPSQAAVQACITHANQVDGVANAYTSVPTLRFQGV